MFAKLKAAKLEVGICLVLLMLIGGFVWNYFHKDQVIDQLKTTTVEQRIEASTMKQQIEEQKASAGITDKVTNKVKQESQVLVEKTQAIQVARDAKLHAIEQQYDALPATENNQVAKANATNEVIADSMWDTYCTVNPSAKECAGRLTIHGKSL